MKIHHLNCMTFYRGVREVTHCLLLESSDGLVLVDTGLGTDDFNRPTLRMLTMIAANWIPWDLNQTALYHVISLGYSPDDVRHIVLTHLHFDHSGGLPDFPRAKVHVYGKEFDAAMHPRRTNFLDITGLEPEHWGHVPDWRIHNDPTRPWFGLECLPVIGSEEDGVLLVPLTGHTPGHCGVAVWTGEYWLLHCGDAFVRNTHVDPENPRSPFPRWYAPIERVMFPAAAREKVRELLRNYPDKVKVICSHDPAVYLQCRINSLPESQPKDDA